MKAAIDIGSNTILLLVGEKKANKIHVIYEDQRAPRLGKGVDTEHKLSNISMRKAVDILTEYKATIQHSYPEVDEVKLVATSAVRDATNRASFIKRIKQATGYEVEILSGAQEAALTFAGATSMAKDINKPKAVIDIGGGSTEIAIGEKTVMNDRHSFNIGSVRFTERYLPGSPPAKNDVDSCKKAIEEALKNRAFELPEETVLIGVSGTVTAAASILKGLQTYQADKLNEQIVNLNEITALRKDVSLQGADKLLARHPTILKGRADVFLAALLILEKFMAIYQFNEIIVSTGGIRHGALMH